MWIAIVHGNTISDLNLHYGRGHRKEGEAANALMGSSCLLAVEEKAIKRRTKETMPWIPKWVKGLEWVTNDGKWRKIGQDGDRMLNTNSAMVKLRLWWGVQVEICNYRLTHGLNLRKQIWAGHTWITNLWLQLLNCFQEWWFIIPSFSWQCNTT